MSTENLKALCRVSGQWDETEQTANARKELRDIRAMCCALLEGGLDYGPSSSGAFVDAVKMVRALAAEKP